MKKAKWKFGFVFICIILSFFSLCSFAVAKAAIDNPSEVGINGASANVKNTNSWTFTCRKTGVYAVKLVDGDGENGEDWCITTGGQYVRLACYQTQDDTTGETFYQVYSPISSVGDTSCKVLLFEGQSYTVKSNKSSGLNTIMVSYDTSDNKLDYKQSKFSSYARTKVNNEDDPEAGIEPSRQEYEPKKNADDEEPVYKYSEPKGIQPIAGAFQKSLVKLLLGLGDYVVKLISDLVGDQLTITNLIFNRVDSVNPNFYMKDADGNSTNQGLASAIIQEAITKWYTFFRRIAMLIYLIAILGIGIRVILNSTAKGIQTARELFVEWLKGFLYLILMPWGIYLLFSINEILVAELCDASDTTDYMAGSSFNDGVEWSVEDIEYRSPAYVSKYTGIRGFGTDSANSYYIKNVKNYAANFDLMRIVRAYAGATYLLSYTIIWYILIGQLLTFIYIYYKRYFMISFFIGIFPVMCIFQAIGIIKDGKSTAVSGWLGELVSNIFTQFIHALIYTIITALCVDLLYSSLTNNQGGSAKLVNWIIIIVAINFVPEGEKIVRSILKAIGSGSTAEGLGDGGLKKGINAVRTGAKRIISG